LDCSRYIGCLHESKSVSFRCPNFSSLADAEQGTLSSLLAKVLVAENSTASRAERNRHRRANEVITLEPMSSAAEAEKRADFEIARIMSSVAEAERVVDEVIQRSGNHSYREYQEALREIAAAGVAYSATLISKMVAEEIDVFWTSSMSELNQIKQATNYINGKNAKNKYLKNIS
jgi:uncharacterized hydantoinase/oxoprolinase family protein